MNKEMVEIIERIDRIYNGFAPAPGEEMERIEPIVDLMWVLLRNHLQQEHRDERPNN